MFHCKRWYKSIYIRDRPNIQQVKEISREGDDKRKFEYLYMEIFKELRI